MGLSPHGLFATWRRLTSAGETRLMPGVYCFRVACPSTASRVSFVNYALAFSRGARRLFRAGRCASGLLRAVDQVCHTIDRHYDMSTDYSPFLGRIDRTPA